MGTNCCPPTKPKTQGINSIQPSPKNTSYNPPETNKTNNLPINKNSHGISKQITRLETINDNKNFTSNDLTELEQTYLNMIMKMTPIKQTICGGAKGKIRKFNSYKFKRTVEEKVLNIIVITQEMKKY